jgi:hypothetical protein
MIKTDKPSTEHGRKLSSQSLAALIIDALIDAGLIDKQNLQRAMAIAVEEIDVRKAAGDY